MYDFLRGAVARRTPTQVVLDVNGVGFQIGVSLLTSDRVPDPPATITLLTHLLVQDDRVRLFGFATAEERALFLQLTAVPGIGPSVGLALLSGNDANTLWDLIRNEDWKAIARTRGIGQKIAQRVCTELKDRAARIALPQSASREIQGESNGTAEDGIAALLVLGYPEAQARKAIQAARQRAGVGADVATLIREALQST